MFRLERQENPLDLLAAHTAGNLVQGQLQNQENAKIQKILAPLNENSSDLEFLQAGLALPEKHRDSFFKAHEVLSKGRQEKGKQQREAQERELSQQNLWNYAMASGVDPSQIAEGTPFEEGRKIIEGLKEKPLSEGAISNRPVPPEIGNKIKQLLEQNPKASATELTVKFDEAGIPRAYTNSLIETRRREAENVSKGDINVHNSWAKYDEQIREDADRAKKQLSAIADIRDAIQKGAADPWGLVNWARNFGDIGKTLSMAFQSAAQGQMGAALPNLIEGFRQLFGVRITDSDLAILKDKLPDYGKTKEANEAVLKILEKYAKPLIEKNKIAKQVKKEFGGYRPINFDELIDERLEAAEANIKSSPKQLTETDLDYYLKAANNDPDEAAEMARKDGFVW